MIKEQSQGSNGRDAQGRFKKGNAGSPGNHHAKRVEAKKSGDGLGKGGIAPPKNRQFGQPDGNPQGRGPKKGSVYLFARIRRRLEEEIAAGRIKADEAVDKYLEGLCDKGDIAFFRDFLDRDEGKPETTIRADVSVTYSLNLKGVPRDAQPAGNGRNGN